MEKEKARKPISLPSLNTLLLVGFVFHLIFIYSVFDCYFTSPVVHGMQAFNVSVNDERLSKRVVLISADGLRADLLFESNGFRGALPSNDTEGIDVVAPYLHSIISNRGAYGVSHTRVPTESRPGHVAIIAGMYEDVSAVTKGWKVNPVEFDSVFNRSSGTWAFGSPDIVPMFTKSAEGRVSEWCYDESEEDFTKDATALDFWVLERLRELLRDNSFSESLHQSGVVFFLHLLGLDTTGHSYRPFSREYMHNIQVVDRIVREVEAMVEEFYGHDGDTSFVFTADHGMSVIGNHGDGHPDNTRTPYIVWGKGLRGPLADAGFSSHDAYSEGWEFRSSSNELLYRRDIDQADLAPLMTALLGINWPVNSVGVVPVDLLNPSETTGVDSKVRGDGTKQDGEWFKAQVKFVNAKVILEQYRVKHELKQTHKLFYTPFPSLSGDRYIRELDMLEEYIFSNSSEFSIHEKVNHHSDRLIADALAGLHYLQTYERTLIRAMVSMAYTGWAAWAGSRVFFPLSSKRVGSHNIATVAIQFLSLAVLFGMSGMFWMERAPWTYYLYLGFPVFFWNRVISTLVTTITANPLHVSDLLRLNRGTIFKTVRNALLVGCALSCMVLGYTHRSIWSIGFIIIGVAWPLLQWDVVSRRSLGQKTWWWTVSCLIAAVFPLLKVNKEENLGNIILGGLAALLVGGMILREIVILVPHHSDKKVVLVLVGVQSLLILIALLVTRSSVLSLQAKEGLPKWCQATGWSVLIISLLVTFLPVLSIDATAPAAKQVLYLRYLLGLTPLFIILSLSDETLFFVSYTFVMGLWAEVERVVSRPRIVAGDVNGTRSGEEILSIYRFKADDLRIALFFLFFVQIAFFGTGNVASVSSFYLSPVYRLVPVFNPFFMSGLLVCKIITPYVILAIATAAVTHSLGLPPFSLFLVALCVTDGMTLIFFFNVTDTGSWLEIGQTISFFVITSLLTLWSGGICVLGEWLMRDVLRGKGEEAMSRGKSKTQ
ncbi:Phosphatidylinositolglycan class N-domain-containing protein [Lentinula edodes]|uniref:Phosphatidylinositolglycan class N-domain-containing protein n=1 Tax=Lentinula edodes TaxID=5353 RepID=UPI001E8E154C|nr:Phosphatidylinositolglycan class N-domain-containing protein [Lentinula edodes]KAH7871399.1 Phosphatidylinositolglycan class N-domain-containing protein [Lentinula edodes]